MKCSTILKVTWNTCNLLNDDFLPQHYFWRASHISFVKKKKKKSLQNYVQSVPIRL